MNREVRNDYKQTNFDIAQDEVPRANPKIRIVDKPIPLDTVIPNETTPVQMDFQERYQRLRQVRDRLLNHKHEFKPVPLPHSPVKKQPQDTESKFEPQSAKILPVSKEREERIRILKRMIYDNEMRATLKPETLRPETPVPVKTEIPYETKQYDPVAIDQPAEELTNITLKPELKRAFKDRESKADKTSELDENNRVTQRLIKTEKLSDTEKLVNSEPIHQSDTSTLDDAIENFQSLKLQDLSNELNSFELKQHNNITEIQTRLNSLDRRISKLEELIDHQRSLLKYSLHLNWRHILIFFCSISMFLTISFFLAD